MSEAAPAQGGTADEPASPFQEETFGDYRLTHLLGKGGMASVYRAVRSGPMGFAKQVAVKRLHERLTDNDQVLKALINEARLGGQLKHPNIVEVYEFNKVGNTYYLAMEFVDGWTLDRITKLSREWELPVPVEVVLDIMIQICEGLHYAHTVESLDGQEVKLVHRDLKPANIILGRDGVAKVMDFGIAKAATNLFQTTLADTTKGTPHYMSPEQVAGSPNLEATSDLFAMGSVLYELVTGRVLFTGESLVAVLFAVARAETAAAVGELNATLAGLGDVVGRCLEKEPGDRYASARDLRDALQRLRDSCPGGATITSYLYALRGRMTRDHPDPEDEEGPEFATLLQPDSSDVRALKAHELAETRKAADEAVEQMAGQLKLGDEDQHLPFAETVQAPTSPRPRARKKKRGAPKTTEGPGAISPQQGTRPGLRPTRVYTRESTPEQRRRRAIAAASLVILLAIAGVLGWLEFGPEDEPTPEPSPLAEALPVLPKVGDLRIEPAPTPKPPAHRRRRAARTAPAPAPTARPAPTPAPTARPAPTPVMTDAIEPLPPPIGTPTPQPTPESVAVLGRGTLKVKACKPWARVYVDGRDTGKNTPLFGGIGLPAGKHTIELRNYEKQARVSKTITIAPNAVFVLAGYDFEHKTWIR